MSRFVGHESCPRCGSRDNVAVYDDGHKWCFGCSYYVPSKDTLESLNRRLIRQGEEELEASGIDPSLFSSTIPERPLKWIQKYGITDTELHFNGIAWCDLRKTLVFPIIRNGNVVLTNERYFGDNPKHPKYLTFGNKTDELLYLEGANIRDKLIFVEDFVSAIKVRRLISTMPLLGVSVPEGVLTWTKGRFKALGVWLDLDKAAEGLREAAKASLYVPCRAILSQADPKELSMNQIHSTLKEYKLV